MSDFAIRRGVDFLMKGKRALYLLLGFILFCGCISAQKPKRVYITLDVSSSMSGNKYVMANYTAQLLSVFCDPQDYVGPSENQG